MPWLNMKRKLPLIKNPYFLLLVFLIIILVFLGFIIKDKIIDSFFVFLKFFREPFSDLNQFLNNTKVVFTEKLILNEENKHLKETIDLLKSQALLVPIFQKELEEVERDLGRIKFYEEEPILAKVIFRPPKVLFDSLIIDLGKESGLEKNMKVVAYGYIFIGRVKEVYQNSSKVKLISKYNHEENVFLENAGFSAIARGQGNYELMIELPSSLEIEVGERVYTLSPQPYLIGLIEKIEKSETDPLQKLHLTFPFNFNELKSVFIVR